MVTSIVGTRVVPRATVSPILQVQCPLGAGDGSDGPWDQHPPPPPPICFCLCQMGRGGRGMGPHHWDVEDSFLPILFPVTFKWLAPKCFLIAACFSQ